MTIFETNTSYNRKSALIAGISLLILALVAPFSYGFVLGNVVVQGDAVSTFNNITSSIHLFNSGIFGWLITLICDIMVAWALYNFLNPINKNLSLLGALFRLTYATILGIAVLNLVIVSLFARSSDLFNEQLPSIAMVFLDAFHFMFAFGLVIFGGHLFILGYLSYHSRYIPKIISILLFIASFGYVVIHLFSMFLPHYEGLKSILEVVFTLPMIVGELGFGIWLLVRGGRTLNRG